MNWYLKVLKSYITFRGRAGRAEYWTFVLFNAVFTIGALTLDHVFGVAVKGVGYGPVYILYVLATFLPGLAVLFRRLHDVGKSGWMALVGFVPIVGAGYLLYLLVQDSDPNENQFGAPPQAEESPTLKVSDDTVLLAVILWPIILRIPSLIITANVLIHFLDIYSSPWYMKYSTLTGYVSMLIPLILAFLVKHKSKRIILLVLSMLYLLSFAVEIFILNFKGL